ncbi:MAG: AAA family ATPase, partial [Candidatus Electrothrix sp. LOE1_4_5]|nr:AAA family ATPase [Candidatus Electrothrix gigas]
ICPEITDPYSDNIYKRSAEAKANPRLKRYDDQGWWLTVMVPIVKVFLYALLVEGVARLLSSSLHFNWWLSSFFLIGWLSGQTLTRAIRSRLGEKSAWLVIIVAIIILFVSSEPLVKYFITDPFIQQAAFGVAGGVAFGVAVGVAVGVSFILGVLRFYFWLPELLWTTFLKFAPILPAHRLSYLPFYYDQLIILPLPFIPTFIAQAYQENQAAARQTIDYLITSTNQQKAAQKAMGLIAVEECSHCRTAKDIAAIRDQLSWISDQQSPGLTACLDISQDVIAALEASSLYRKAQQLDKVIPKIDRQRNALAAVSAREATSFGSVLDSWQRILETARRTLHEQAAQSNEIPQVYLVGPALDPNRAGPLFKGRRDLFRQIETLTLSAQHPTLVMHGGRRSGKTSTLNYLPKWLPSDILPLLIDGQSLAATSTLAGFAEDFAERAELQL